jgi:hypothetical protein
MIVLSAKTAERSIPVDKLFSKRTLKIISEWRPAEQAAATCHQVLPMLKPALLASR